MVRTEGLDEAALLLRPLLRVSFTTLGHDLPPPEVEQPSKATCIPETAEVLPKKNLFIIYFGEKKNHFSLERKKIVKTIGKKQCMAPVNKIEVLFQDYRGSAMTS